ncbi:hypothetical protein cypCar_00044130 [Cyprinus carpio]|nr:hypothetical protein cypCar_00044130 [Cyprinus carpio]
MTGTFRLTRGPLHRPHTHRARVITAQIRAALLVFSARALVRSVLLSECDAFSDGLRHDGQTELRGRCLLDPSDGAARFALPSAAAVGNGSSCGGGAGVPPELLVSFGAGHALTLLFSSDGRLYRVASISLQYNLSDTSTFPQSSSTGLMKVMTNVTEISARLNSTYRCVSPSTVSLSPEVNLTFSDVHMEAYMSGANLSTDESVCSADQTVTTAAPTQSPRTSAAPSPVPPPAPQRGNYTLTNRNGTACLLALMGLQLNITHRSRALNQNSTTQKFYLSAVNVSAFWPDMTDRFVEGNGSLNFLQCSVGRSYVCSAEQTLSIVPSFSINTFRLQLQPFNVTASRFSAVEECRADQENMLIPIIVGVALAGLVLIVLIAYLIGRKRTHAGYQTI